MTGSTNPATEIQDGMIVPGGAPASWGFTRESFTWGAFGSYLWRNGDRVFISVIECTHPGRGDFGRLVRAIEADGRRVAVPTPFPHMQAILKRWGFVSHREYGEPVGEVDVWERPLGEPAPET